MAFSWTVTIRSFQGLQLAVDLQHWLSLWILILTQLKNISFTFSVVKFFIGSWLFDELCRCVLVCLFTFWYLDWWTSYCQVWVNSISWCECDELEVCTKIMITHIPVHSENTIMPNQTQTHTHTLEPFHGNSWLFVINDVFYLTC